MAICESTSFVYPLLADIYYPIVTQSALGSVQKQWVLDKSVACNFSSPGSAMAEDIKPNVLLTQDQVLSGRIRTDIRISSSDARNALTNILITGIRDASGNPIYFETSGPRAGKSTLFEIATFEPYVNPFGNVEFYKIVIRRSENQGNDI